MSNKILFLHNTTSQKAEFEKCEKVFKSVFRKFRKSVVFSYLQTDLSESCINLFRKKLYEEIELCDAVIMAGDKDFHDKRIILKDMLGEYAAAHYLKGCVICHMPSHVEADSDNEHVVLTHSVKYADFKKAVDVAISLALERKRKLTICSQEGIGPYVEDAVSLAFDKALHIDREHLALDEALYICMRSVPTFDVVITSEQAAIAMKMHIGYTVDFNGTLPPDGFCVFYTEKGKIYSKNIFPFEKIDNTHLFYTLITFCAILEKELSMKNAAIWLKKAAAVAFESHGKDFPDEYIKRVISEIEKPMRNHTR